MTKTVKTLITTMLVIKVKIMGRGRDNFKALKNSIKTIDEHNSVKLEPFMFITEKRSFEYLNDNQIGCYFAEIIYTLVSKD